MRHMHIGTGEGVERSVVRSSLVVKRTSMAVHAAQRTGAVVPVLGVVSSARTLSFEYATVRTYRMLKIARNEGVGACNFKTEFALITLYIYIKPPMRDRERDGRCAMRPPVRRD